MRRSQESNLGSVAFLSLVSRRWSSQKCPSQGWHVWKKNVPKIFGCANAEERGWSACLPNSTCENMWKLRIRHAAWHSADILQAENCLLVHGAIEGWLAHGLPGGTWPNTVSRVSFDQFCIVSVELLLEGWMMLDVGLMHKLHTGLSKGKSPWFKTISKSGMSTVALCFCHGSNLQSAPRTCRCFCNELNWRCSQDPMIAADAGRRSQLFTIHSPQRRTSKSMSLGEEHLAYIASELSLKDLKVHNPVTICLLPLHNAQNTYMYQFWQQAFQSFCSWASSACARQVGSVAPNSTSKCEWVGMTCITKHSKPDVWPTWSKFRNVSKLAGGWDDLQSFSACSFSGAARCTITNLLYMIYIINIYLYIYIYQLIANMLYVHRGAATTVVASGASQGFKPVPGDTFQQKQLLPNKPGKPRLLMT